MTAGDSSPPTHHPARPLNRSPLLYLHLCYLYKKVQSTLLDVVSLLFTSFRGRVSLFSANGILNLESGNTERLQRLPYYSTGKAERLILNHGLSYGPSCDCDVTTGSLTDVFYKNSETRSRQSRNRQMAKIRNFLRTSHLN